MKKTITISDEKVAEKAIKPSGGSTIIDSGTVREEAFLQDAEKEPKRILLSDHIRTITKLRDEKRLTFRAIAEWFGERGIETDHGAIYRAYCASLPMVDDYGQPVEDEEKDADRFIEADENCRLKKS